MNKEALRQTVHHMRIDAEAHAKSENQLARWLAYRIKQSIEQIENAVPDLWEVTDDE